jgi:hypothetical protein
LPGFEKVQKFGNEERLVQFKPAKIRRRLARAYEMNSRQELLAVELETFVEVGHGILSVIRRER